MPDNGIVSVQSRFSANETIERLLAVIAEKNLTVFARVDHAAGAASVVSPDRTRSVTYLHNHATCCVGWSRPLEPLFISTV